MLVLHTSMPGTGLGMPGGITSADIMFNNTLFSSVFRTCKKYLKHLDISKITKSINKKGNDDVNNQINELRKQEKSLISKLDLLYQDKFNGIVSEEMYL